MNYGFRGLGHDIGGMFTGCAIIAVVGFLETMAVGGKFAMAARYNYDANQDRHRLNGYLAQRVPSLFLAGSFRMCLNCGVLKGMFPWRTRHPLSRCRQELMALGSMNVVGALFSGYPTTGSFSRMAEKGEVLQRGVGTLRYSLFLGEDSACQVPICAVAA